MHEQLVHIAQKCNQTGSTKYSSEDVRKLQNKLNRVDDKYQEKIIQQSSETSKDPYEVPGEAQVASELSILHDATTSMLQNTEYSSCFTRAVFILNACMSKPERSVFSGRVGVRRFIFNLRRMFFQTPLILTLLIPSLCLVCSLSLLFLHFHPQLTMHFSKTLRAGHQPMIRFVGSRQKLWKGNERGE